MPNIRHARDDVLDIYHILALYQGALRIKDYETRVLACFLVLVCGRLGLRIGEALHLHTGWIDWERGVIEIPEYEPCGCAYCWKAAKDKAKRLLRKSNDDSDDLDVSIPVDTIHEPWDRWDEILEDIPSGLMPVDELPDSLANADRDQFSLIELILYIRQWEPKEEMSARTVPFNWSVRITTVLAIVCKNQGLIDVTYQNARRTLNKAAQHSLLPDDDLRLHVLRSTAETWWGDIGLDQKSRRDLGGWKNEDETSTYAAQSPGVLSDKMRSALGMDELGFEGADFLAVNERPMTHEPFDLHKAGTHRAELMTAHDPGPTHSPRTTKDNFRKKGYVYNPELARSLAIAHGKLSTADRADLVKGYYKAEHAVHDSADNPFPTSEQPTVQQRMSDWIDASTPLRYVIALTSLGVSRLKTEINRQYRAWTSPHFDANGRPYWVANPWSKITQVGLGVLTMALLLAYFLSPNAPISLINNSFSVDSPQAIVFIGSIITTILYLHLTGKFTLEATRTDPTPTNPFE